MDILCEHIVTGERKELPPNVVKALSGKWRPVPIVESRNINIPQGPPERGEIHNQMASQMKRFKTSKPSEPEQPEEPKKEAPNFANDIDSLRALYESKTGLKPDKRWGADKLNQKIEEQKGII